MNNLKILVVDDEQTFRDGIKHFLITQGYGQIRTTSDGAEAIEMVQADPPDVVLLDLYMPVMNGLQVMKAMHAIKPDLPIFVISCEADEEYKSVTLLLGAYDYLTKPLSLSYLFSYMEARLKQHCV